MKKSKNTFVWGSCSSVDLSALSSVLKQWVGTPYAEGQCSKQSGVDCVRFAINVACGMAKVPMINVPRYAPLTSQFIKGKAYKMIKILREQLPQYKTVDITDKTVLYPADIIVSKVGIDPGHLQVVGPEPGSIYHADRGMGVVKTGFVSLDKVEQVWRLCK